MRLIHIEDSGRAVAGDNLQENMDRKPDFEEILALVEFLRSPSGCSWDRQQDEKSLRPFFLEECYELIDAIDVGDSRRKLEELGDILLHCAFQIRIAEERRELTREEVFSTLLDKMKRRHPHLFDGYNTEAPCPTDWETIKKEERLKKGMEHITDGLPNSLPPLLTAYRLQERVSSLNFDWHEPDGAFDKVSEELEEVREKYIQDDRDGLDIEIGDLLFAVVNVSRLLGHHPDNSLRRAIDKFAGRFDKLMKIVREKGLDIDNTHLEELDEIWDSIKETEKKHTKEA